MSTIMLDNWTSATAFLQLTNNTAYSQKSSKLSIANLLMAIVFWDEINIPEGINSIACLFNELKKDSIGIQLLDFCKNMGISIFRSSSLPHFSPNMDEDALLAWGNENLDKLLARTELYLDISDKNRINYFPHPQRSEYLLENNLIKKGLNRYTLLNNLDKALAEYYADLDKEYSNDFLNFDYPVLYDYIRNQAKSISPVDELEVALRLRKDKDVIAFQTVREQTNPPCYSSP